MIANTPPPPNLNDFQIAELIINVLRTGLDALGLNSVLIKQLYQHRQVGIEQSPTLYFFKVVAPRYGYPGRQDIHDTNTNTFSHHESVWRTPTYQVSGYGGYTNRSQTVFDSFGFEPEGSNFGRSNFGTTLPTASDITEKAADVMQTSSTRLALLERNVGIIRITDVRESYFTDERQRYEQNPSFDFQLSYQHTILTRVDPVTDYKINSNLVQG